MIPGSSLVPLSSKALFALAFAAATAAVIFYIDTNDGSATTILWFVAIAAFLLGVAALVADPDEPPWVAPDTQLAQQAPAGARPSLPSLFPLLGALALGLLAVAAATNAVVEGAAGVALLLVGLGWFLQHWTEHPTSSAHYLLRLKDRFFAPLALPLGIFALIAVIAGSLSRIFLALPENGTRAVALAIAVVILVSAFIVAASERMARTAVAILCVVALACAIGAGAAGLAHGERTFEPAPASKIKHAPLPPGINPSVIQAKTGAGSTSSPSTTAATPGP